MFFRDQDLRATLLPPGRREPLGGRPLPTAGHRHAGPARPAPAVRPTRCPARLGRPALPVASCCSRRTPRGDSRPSPPDASARPWSSSGSGSRPAAGGSSSDSLDGRRFEFAVERAIFLTVLHRLFAPGSDRAAEHVEGRTTRSRDATSLQLHHLYRAMAWLGEELPEEQQAGQDAVRTPLHQGPDRGGAVRPPAGPLQRAATGLLRHHLDLLRGRGRPDDRPAGPQQGPSARPQADGRGGRARRPGASDLLRTVAGQHRRRDDADPRGGSPAATLRHRHGLHRGRSGDDQPGDDRGSWRTDERGWQYILGARMRSQDEVQGRGALPGRSLPGRASEAAQGATTPPP